jgi:hypothetical protein
MHARRDHYLAGTGHRGGAEHDHDTIPASYPGTTNYQPSSATMTPP